MSESEWVLDGPAGWDALERVTDDITFRLYRLQEEAADEGKKFRVRIETTEIS